MFVLIFLKRNCSHTLHQSKNSKNIIWVDLHKNILEHSIFLEKQCHRSVERHLWQSHPPGHAQAELQALSTHRGTAGLWSALSSTPAGGHRHSWALRDTGSSPGRTDSCRNHGCSAVQACPRDRDRLCCSNSSSWGRLEEKLQRIRRLRSLKGNEGEGWGEM